MPVGQTVDGSRPRAPRLYAVRDYFHARRLRLVVALASATNRPVYLCSYPKTGRTWLRYLLASYIDRAFECGIGVDLQSMYSIVPNLSTHRRRGIGAFQLRGDERIPLILASHASRARGGFDERNRAIFLLRGVHDVMVSSFFHASRQRRTGERYRGDMSSFLRDANTGVPRFVRYHNDWADVLSRMEHSIVAYEELQRDPAGALRRVLEFLEVPIDEAELAAVVHAGQFEAMRDLELRTGVDGQRFDRSDPEALRMRRGRIGGYTEYLSPEDITRISEMCRAELSPTATAMFEEQGLAM